MNPTDNDKNQQNRALDAILQQAILSTDVSLLAINRLFNALGVSRDRLPPELRETLDKLNLAANRHDS